jgi:hypothetical protein
VKSLKEILKENHNSKTKAELIQFVSGVKNLIGDDYNDISGIDPSEMDSITKKEILAVIEAINQNYKSVWENRMQGASVGILKAIFARMDADDDLFSASNAANADFAAELGSIDFEKLIGGPLNACVTAQSNASLATVNFIKEVGFDDDDNLRMVDFSHKKDKANPNLGKDPNDVPAGTDVTTPIITENVVLKVPFVSILNIPSLRIETCTIDFNVKLNSVYSRDVSSEFGINASASGGWGPIKFKVSASYKRSSSTGVKVEKEYTMGVKVVATNDSMPAGLERVLGILSE